MYVNMYMHTYSQHYDSGQIGNIINSTALPRLNVCRTVLRGGARGGQMNSKGAEPRLCSRVG